MNKKSKKSKRKSHRTTRCVGNRRYSGSIGRFSRPYCPDGWSYIAESDAKIIGKLGDKEKLCSKDGSDGSDDYTLIYYDDDYERYRFTEWKNGRDRKGRDKDGYDRHGRDMYGYDKNGLDIDYYDKEKDDQRQRQYYGEPGQGFYRGVHDFAREVIPDVFNPF